MWKKAITNFPWNQWSFFILYSQFHETSVRLDCFFFFFFLSFLHRHFYDLSVNSMSFFFLLLQLISRISVNSFIISHFCKANFTNHSAVWKLRKFTLTQFWQNFRESKSNVVSLTKLLNSWFDEIYCSTLCYLSVNTIIIFSLLALFVKLMSRIFLWILQKQFFSFFLFHKVSWIHCFLFISFFVHLISRNSCKCLA